MRGKILAVGYLFCLSFAWVNGAHSQTLESAPDANLKGVKTLKVTFSQLTPDAITCGLSLDLIQPIVTAKILRSGISLVSTTDILATLGLMTTFDPGRDACGTSATLGVYKKVSYYDESVGWLRTGYVVLWQRGQQVMSGIAEHSDSTGAIVQRLAEVLLESWKQENAVN